MMPISIISFIFTTVADNKETMQTNRVRTCGSMDCLVAVSNDEPTRSDARPWQESRRSSGHRGGRKEGRKGGKKRKKSNQTY